MTARKFLFQSKKVKKKKVKPRIYLIVEKGLSFPNDLCNTFKGFVFRKVSVDIDYNPISILELSRKIWKNEELTNKKSDFLLCLVNQYFSLYGFKELLKSKTHDDENLDFFNLTESNHILICYSKGKKKSDLLPINLRESISIEEENFNETIVNKIDIPSLDSEYKNLQ